ncbi:hypothetical protein CSUNSWCD_1455 [Campylobacter showae CSUNSWCD]|uniref:Uncharacterized protein n=1 Tax=Campylobacter showae CSUNSWCD TaxID=1244083 RepID=M5INM1_9BACT|nr:hypothetical protein CSUNSWCD_1455 [Campylobacter showae CSUNSWCD]
MSIKEFKFYAFLFKRGNETDKHLTAGDFVAFVKSFRGQR